MEVTESISAVAAEKGLISKVKIFAKFSFVVLRLAVLCGLLAWFVVIKTARKNGGLRI